MKSKSLIKIGWITAICTFVCIACKPEPEVPLTEKYVSASENFEVNSFTTNLAQGSAIDFTKDSMKFSADFNETVSWEITIMGLSHPTDHAVKVLKGTSSKINSSEIFWAGESDNIYFFKANEKLYISVKYLGSDIVTLFDSYTIEKTKKFNKGDNLVLIDFEEVNGDAIITSPDAVNTFFDTENLDEELDQLKFSSRKDLPIPVQGNGLVYLKGVDLVGQPSSFYIGGVKSSNVNIGFKEGTPLDQVYLNLYANSNGNKTTKIVVLIPGIGGDEFKIERNITWDGWKLISSKLSDFIQFTAGSLGTSKINLAAVKNVNIQIHSGDGPGKEAEVAVDFVCFTYGGPFSQSK